MASQWLKARQTKYVLFATVYILIVVSAAIAANDFAVRFMITPQAANMTAANGRRLNAGAWLLQPQEM